MDNEALAQALDLSADLLRAHNPNKSNLFQGDSNMTKGGTLTTDLKVSLFGQGIVTVLAGLVVAVMFYLQFSLWGFLGALVAVILVWAWLMHRINRFRWRRLVISHHGEQVVLIGRDKYREAGRIGKRLVVSPFVCCFSVHGERHRYWLCLFADSTDSSSWRKLREVLSSG